MEGWIKHSPFLYSKAGDSCACGRICLVGIRRRLHFLPGWKKNFVAEKFSGFGDLVKLRIDGEIVSLKQVIAAKEGKTLPTIELKDDYMQTVTGKSVEVRVL